MSKILELLRAEGLKLDGSKSSGPRAKVLAQADSMLEKLEKMSSPDEMNSKTSNQNWWAPKSKGNKRVVTMRYGGRMVAGASETVENTIEAVADVIKKMRKAIENTSDSDWANEEEKRKKD